MLQKDSIARTLVKFYELFRNKPSPLSFDQVCDQYLRANAEVIERERRLVDRVKEIQIEYQELGEGKFKSKYL